MKTQAQTLPIEFGTIIDAKTFNRIDGYRKTLIPYLKTGKPVATLRGEPAVLDGDSNDWVIQKSCFRPCLLDENSKGLRLGLNREDPLCFPVAVVVHAPKGNGLHVVGNGDEDNRYATIVTDLKDMSTITSFRCLALLVAGYKDFTGKSAEHECFKIEKMLANGELVLVDSTRQMSHKASAKELDMRDAHKENPKNPMPKGQPGFTLVGNEWHRSGTALFYHPKKECSYLTGQDESQFFGVRLADNPKSVKAAFISLMPPAVRKAKSFVRQGEWFFVPVKYEKIPACVLNGEGGTIILPKDAEQSNDHIIEASAWCISKDGRIFIEDANISHAQHAQVNLAGYHEVLLNTAKHSVSVEGVD